MPGLLLLQVGFLQYDVQRGDGFARLRLGDLHHLTKLYSVVLVLVTQRVHGARRIASDGGCPQQKFLLAAEALEISEGRAALDAGDLRHVLSAAFFTVEV